MDHVSWKGYKLNCGKTLFIILYAFRCYLCTKRVFKSRSDSHHLFPNTSFNLPTFPFVVHIRSPQKAQSSNSFCAFVLIQQKPGCFRHEGHEQQHYAGWKRTQHCQPAPLQSYSWETKRKEHQLAVQTGYHLLERSALKNSITCNSSFL